MKYAYKAINLSNENEEEFIKKYILDECQKMVDGLEKILSNDIFTFKKYNGEYKYKYKDKRLLLKFRGEKLTGALEFISNIVEYKGIIDVQKFVDKITNLNKEIEPILKKELKAVKKELKKNRHKKKRLYSKYKPIKERFDFFERLKIRITKIIEDKEKDTEKKTDVNLCFTKKYPEYTEIREYYFKYKKKIKKVEQLIFQLENLKEKFTGYIYTIKKNINKN